MRTAPPIDNGLQFNTPEYENRALIQPQGFREYDLRWILGKEVNNGGLHRCGLALGTLLRAEMQTTAIVVGHDYRAYSLGCKQALCLGLLQAGCRIIDIGLVMTPVVYFAQILFGSIAGAMVTASHNENGWTGIKISHKPPLTFGPEEIAKLKELAFAADLGSKAPEKPGSYELDLSVIKKYLAHIGKGRCLRRRPRIVVSCGNGTPGIWAESFFTALGAEVKGRHLKPDHRFPHHNPNPEDMSMLHDLGAEVVRHKADLGLAFDGDGDRCGVVDEKGSPVFSDKIGLLLARDLARLHPGSRFVIDVKSTGLFDRDALLKKKQCPVVYGKTGHSYMKRALQAHDALAGFEKSGHFFFAPPYGQGYDDAFLAAAMVLSWYDRAGGSLSEHIAALPLTYQSPTLAAHCADTKKYAIVEKIAAAIEGQAKKGKNLSGSRIADVHRVNGIRFTLEDGGFGLLRASSNKPELVIVGESPTSKAALREIIAYIEGFLRKEVEVGALPAFD